eukprot:TRINITY_DN229_c0_g1_i12.p1 TRINITY_DN229_c0_g1~~TRINITY_DN229_c0_g1_i12.p1  ORF type:complete len:179 (-),score=2.12 TRINITY_DN229_c0_g1_i12:119-655(-)
MVFFTFCMLVMMLFGSMNKLAKGHQHQNGDGQNGVARHINHQGCKEKGLKNGLAQSGGDGRGCGCQSFHPKSCSNHNHTTKHITWRNIAHNLSAPEIFTEKKNTRIFLKRKNRNCFKFLTILLCSSLPLVSFSITMAYLLTGIERIPITEMTVAMATAPRAETHASVTWSSSPSACSS